MEPYEKPVKVFSIDQYFVFTDANGKHYLYRVEDVDGLIYNLQGVLQPSQATGLQDLSSTLVPPQGQMYAFEIGVWGYIDVILYQPSSTLRLSPQAVVSHITEDISPIEDPSPLTFTVTWPNTSLSVNIVNVNPFGLPQPYVVKFIGYKYKVNQLAQIIQEPNGEYTLQVVSREIPEDILNKLVDDWLYGSLPEITIRAFSR